MLSACHGRVERQCETLLRLVPHLAANGPDQAAREAAQNVMRYFDTSAPHHHADEEEDLFPALLRSAPDDRACAAARVLSMRCARSTANWNRPGRNCAGSWKGSGSERRASWTRTKCERLVDLYRSHIAREEEATAAARRRAFSEPRNSTASAARCGRGAE